VTRFFTAMAAALAVAAVAASPALAGSWLSPITTGAGVSGQNPVVAMNARGDTMVAWVSGGQPRSAFRPAGAGAFEAGEAVAGPGTVTTLGLALDPQGNAVMIFVDNGGLMGAARPAGGTWALDGAGQWTFGASSYALAIGPDGTAVAVWTDGVNVNARYRPLGGSFGSQENVATAGAGNAETVSVAMNASGAAVAGWRRAVTTPFIEAAVRPAGGSFDPAEPVTSTVSASAPDVAIDDAGNAYAVFLQSSRVGWASRPAGGGWAAGSPDFLSDAALVAAGPQLAVDAAGNAVASWQITSTTPAQVQGAFRPAGGAFGGATTLSDPALAASAPSPAVADGVALATWLQNVTGGQRVDSRQFAGGSWGATQPVSGTHLSMGATPGVAMDDQGNASAAWEANAGPEDILSNVFDGAAPTFTMATPDPVSAPLGAVFSFGVTDVADRWSATDTPAWDFGDGSTGTGFATQHTYASSGIFAPAVTVRDAVGNSRTRSANVTVTAAQAPPPPPGPPPAALPPPVLAQLVNATPVSGTVRVRLPRTRRFIPLAVARQIPMGSIVDARKGRVRITGTDGRTVFSAEFYEGMFRLAQRRRRGSPVDIHLFGGSFRGCPRAPKAQLAAVRSKKRSVRRLWGDGSGRFRTVGRFSAATLRGTRWLTDDRCNGTRTTVRRGAVNVRDFVKRKTIVLRARPGARRTYFAAASSRSARR